MPDPFSHIIGHETVRAVLGHALAHPGNAYLFHGPSGAGKSTVARAFASGLLALTPDRALETHPDFVPLICEEGAKNIGVEEARALVARMQMTAAAGGHTVALIEGAERLSASAANALLKAVEEPSARAVYLFITENPGALPATLRSRLAPITFGRVPVALITDWLVTRGANPDLAKSLAIESAGLPGLALAWLMDPELLASSKAEAHDLLSVLQTASLGERIAKLELLAKGCESSENPEEAWRRMTAALMRQAFESGAPADQSRVAEGLVLAWRFIGSPISPRLGLEWTAVRPYRIGKRLIPSFLSPSYL